MSFDESNTGAVVEETTATDFTGTTSGVSTDEFFNHAGSVSADADLLDTPAGKLPPKQPEIHQGTVTSIGTFTSKNTGSVGIEVHVQSKDTGASDKYTIWAPQEFFNAEFWATGKFNYDALAASPAPGKKQSPRQRYAATINSESATIGKDGSYVNFADVQLLRTIAKEEGRTIPAGTAAPTSGESFVALLNSLCSGINIVYTRRPDSNPGSEYDGQLKINRLLHPSVVSLANFDKKFPPLSFDEKTESYKGYRRAWLND